VGHPDSGPNVTVNGQVLRADGTPLTAAVFQKPTDLGDMLWGLMSLGLTCLDGSCSDKDTRLTLDAQGRFTHVLPESETKGNLLGLVYLRTFSLFAAGPKSASGLDGAFLRAEFRVPAPGITLPELRLWEPQVAAAIAGTTLTLTPTPTAPAAPLPAPTLSLLVTTVERKVLWESSGTVLDLRLLEDAADARVVVQAQVGSSGSLDSATLLSGSLLVPGTRAAPPSRGAPCTLGAKSYPAGQCPFTDAAITSGAVGGDAAVATIDLGQPRVLSLVVVRSSSSGTAEWSADGTTWTAFVAQPGSSHLAAIPAGGVTARYVRVQNGNTLQKLAAWW